MRALSLASLGLLSLTAAPACSKIVGIDDVTVLDAGPMPDSGPPPNTVIGRSFTRHLTAAGNMDVPSDLSQGVIQALIVDPAQAAGYRVAPGTGRADGTFTIPDVPDGAPYLLKLDTSYFATTAHDLELRVEDPSRGVPPPALLSAPTAVSFNVQGMTPSVNGPEGTFSLIEVDSLNLGYQGVFGFSQNNARSLMGLYDWSSGANALGRQPLPDSTLGDDLTLLHLRNDVASTPARRKQRLTRVVDMFRSSGITLQDGMTANASGSWMAAAMNRPINMTVTRGTFDSGYDGNSRFEGMRVSVRAHPVRNDALGATVFAADLFDWSRSGTLTDSLGFMYADPFPTDWARVAVVLYDRFRFFRLSGTTLTLQLGASNKRVFPYTGGDPDTAPMLQPPANIRVAGTDGSASGPAPFDGTAPVELTWSAVLAAKLYTVQVVRVFRNGGETVGTTVARLSTAQTSIKIPAEVFSGGSFFAFVVTAVQTPGDYNAGQLIPAGVPHSSAGVVSGLFRLGNLCGNGMLDPGEDCDTGGESATCDTDCTTRVCGDGVRNAMAGEACDTVRDTSSCDGDCSLPLCGDGRINPAIEDCDDGNATDGGNGCSAACRFNNMCGDGIVQMLVESCDPGTPGETATCDSDCTPAQCGDAHRNPLANEQCDDGNADNADGCNTMCQLN